MLCNSSKINTSSKYFQINTQAILQACELPKHHQVNSNVYHLNVVTLKDLHIHRIQMIFLKFTPGSKRQPKGRKQASLFVSDWCIYWVNTPVCRIVTPPQSVFQIFDPPILLKMPPILKIFHAGGDPPILFAPRYTIKHTFQQMLKSVRVDVERWGLEQQTAFYLRMI